MQTVDWESAINVRRSVRSFVMRPVEEETLSRLKDFSAHVEVPFEHNVRVRFFKAPPGSRLYNHRLPAPPDHVAFTGATDVLSISKAGFVGELVVLYATALGLGTCFYGHYSLNELERVMPHLGEAAKLPRPKWGYGKGEVAGERAICISPLGYWRKEGIRLLDRITKATRSYKRKPVRALLDRGVTEDSLSPEILYSLDLARKAPSGANSQHWRFTISPDFKKISVAMPIGYRHIMWEHPNVDIGICASHLWLALGLKGLKPRVQVSEDEGRAVWEFAL